LELDIRFSSVDLCECLQPENTNIQKKTSNETNQMVFNRVSILSVFCNHSKTMHWIFSTNISPFDVSTRMEEYDLFVFIIPNMSDRIKPIINLIFILLTSYYHLFVQMKQISILYHHFKFHIMAFNLPFKFL